MQIVKKIFIGICFGFQGLIMLLFFLNINPQTELIGVTLKNNKPEVKLKEILLGNYQNNYDRWFSDEFPFRSYMIKIYDQIMYIGGGEVNKVYRGRKGDLHGTFWLDNYLIDEMDDETLKEYFSNINYINEQLMLRGKNFVYIITPNKAEIHNNTLPFKYRLIKNKVKLETSKNKKKLSDFLNKKNILNIDLTFLIKEKEKNGEKMFPKTGIHWNQLGAAYGLIEILKKMQLSGINIQQVVISNRTDSTKPTFNETEYKEILNVYYSKEDPPYPVVKLEYSNIGNQRKPSVFAMTTSFSNTIVEQFFFEFGMPFQKLKRLHYNQYYSELFYENNKLKGEKRLPGIQMNQVNYQEILEFYDILIIEHPSTDIPEAHVEFAKNFANYLRSTKANFK